MNEMQQASKDRNVKKKRSKKKKKGQYDDWVSAHANGSYFLFDVETTGSKRNWDRIISMSFLHYDKDGKLLGSFSHKVNPGKVRIANYLTNNKTFILYYCLFFTSSCSFLLAGNASSV